MAERDAPSWVSAPPRRLRWRLRRAINQQSEGGTEGIHPHPHGGCEGGEREKVVSYPKGRGSGSSTTSRRKGRASTTQRRRVTTSLLKRVGSESTLTFFFVEFWSESSCRSTMPTFMLGWMYGVARPLFMLEEARLVGANFASTSPATLHFNRPSNCPATLDVTTGS